MIRPIKTKLGKARKSRLCVTSTRSARALPGLPTTRKGTQAETSVGLRYQV